MGMINIREGMMIDKYADLISTVEIIQEEIDETLRAWPVDHPFQLKVLLYSFGIMVEMCDEVIWSSEDDEREFYDETKTYEDWDSFLTRKLKEFFMKASIINDRLFDKEPE